MEHSGLQVLHDCVVDSEMPIDEYVVLLDPVHSFE